MKTAYFNPFPIPDIAFTTPATERERYAAEGRELYARFLASSPPVSSPPASLRQAQGAASPLLAFVSAHLAADPERSDVVHDLLAYLAEQMIELNKQKQAEMKGFLAWLEREIGAQVDDLSGKTTLQNYLGDYQKDQAPASFDDVLAVLKKNSRKLAVDPGKRAFQEALAASTRPAWASCCHSRRAWPPPTASSTRSSIGCTG